MAPALLMILSLLAAPVLSVVWDALQGSSGEQSNFSRFLNTDLYYTIIIRTFAISAGTALFCIILGYPVAFFLSSSRGFARSVVFLCIITPFWTNLLVRSYGWIIVLSPDGVLNKLLMEAHIISEPLNLSNNIVGVLVGMTQIMLPYVILPLYAVMTRLDPSLMKAARSLGAKPYTAFFKVYLPLTLPGLMAGALLVFTMSLGFFVVPAILGGTSGVMLAQLIDFNINVSMNWGMAATLSTVLLAITFAFFWIGARWFGLGSIWGIVK